MRWQTKSEANDHTKQLELIVWCNKEGEWCWTVNHWRYSQYSGVYKSQVKFFDEPCASEEEARAAAETWCNQYTPPSAMDIATTYVNTIIDYLSRSI